MCVNTVAVVLTQKVDPQYWSRTAAHMVQADGIVVHGPLLHRCWGSPLRAPAISPFNPVHPHSEDNRRMCQCRSFNKALKQKSNLKTSCRENTSVRCVPVLPSVTVYDVLKKCSRVVMNWLCAEPRSKVHSRLEQKNNLFLGICTQKKTKQKVLQKKEKGGTQVRRNPKGLRRLKVSAEGSITQPKKGLFLP